MLNGIIGQILHNINFSKTNLWFQFAWNSTLINQKSVTVRPLHSSAKSELAPKEMSKNHCSLRGQGRINACAFTGQKTQRFIEANRAFNCGPIFHSIRATKEASSPPVSMATEEPEKSRTGLPYHFHRWRKVARIICRDSHVASSPWLAREKCPRKKKSDLYHFRNTLLRVFQKLFYCK